MTIFKIFCKIIILFSKNTILKNDYSLKGKKWTLNGVETLALKICN